MTTERFKYLSDLIEEVGPPWKVGDDELLPYHPSASHIPPDYRDGWNRCYLMHLDALRARDQVRSTTTEGRGPKGAEPGPKDAPKEELVEAAPAEQPAPDWRPFGLTVEAALNRGDDPALLFDENSPIRDELRKLLAASKDRS